MDGQSADNSGDKPTRPLWSTAFVAAFVSGFMPRRTATTCANLSLRQAWLVHLTYLLLGAVATALIIAHDPDSRWFIKQFYPLDSRPALQQLWNSLGSWAGTELGYLALALVVLPWATVRGPVRSLWRQALRIAWIHTGHAALLSVVYGTALVVGNNILGSLRYARWYQDPQDRPSVVLLWLAKHYEIGLAVFVLLLIVWYLGAMVRAMTQPVIRAETNLAPLCEVCGYDLSHHDLSARCPECGRPVALSLGDAVRHESPAAIVAGTTQPIGFLKTSALAWFGPQDLLMKLSVTRGLGTAGRHLVVSMVASGLAFAGAVFSGVLLIEDNVQASDVIEMFVVFAFTGTCIAIAVGIGVSLVAAVVGLIVSRREGRSCLAGAVRVACYCGGIFPPWIFCQVSALVLMIHLADTAGVISRYVPIIVGVFFPGATVLLISLYTIGVARRIRYVQYANT